MRFSTERKIIVLIIIAVIICATSGASSAAKKKKAPDKPALPPYRTSGPIPGTSLIYEKLHISDSGAVTVSIHNPERSGVRFRAAFSFYSAKNEFLTGFGVEGFATASASTGYSLSMKDYKKLRQASYMTVLGRAGRAGGDSWE